MNANAPLLQMRGIGKSYPGVRALDGVDFQLKAGEVHVLLGENGAGKSTLMKILSGATASDRGEIRLAGEPVTIRSPYQARALGISTIYQEFSLVPGLSAGENIFLGREPSLAPGVVDHGEVLARSRAVLRRLGIPLDPAARVADLGVAQQQLVEIARALAFEARIIIMDEPTSALTPAEIDTLFGLIRSIRQRGVGIVYISHRMEEIYAIGDRVTVLRDGCRIATHAVADVSVAQLVRLMADRELKDHFPRRAVTPGEPLLEVRALRTADKLRDVSFTLRRGQILGVAGLLGSGRSTLARVLCGQRRAAGGQTDVRGRSVRIDSPSAAVGLGIGYLSEDRKLEGLVLALTVAQNISLANTDRTHPHGVLDRTRQQQLAATQVEQLRIKASGLDQQVVHLSGGNQQKVVLAKWLAHEAQILIFDEPTRGIDVAAKVDIYELMNRLTERGAAILMISSDLPEVLGMSDRILVMHAGHITGEYDPGEVDQATLVRAALGQAP
jgi:ribose transport system ATP-binding protein